MQTLAARIDVDAGCSLTYRSVHMDMTYNSIHQTPEKEANLPVSAFSRLDSSDELASSVISRETPR